VTWLALRSGALEARAYCIGRTDYGPVPFSRMEFLSVDRSQLFETCQIELVENDKRRPVQIRRRIRVPHWLYVTRASLKKLPRPPKSNAEELRAIKCLAALLKADKAMTRERAAAACKDFKISKRGFLERVWHAARKQADLPPVASAGRPKSKR